MTEVKDHVSGFGFDDDAVQAGIQAGVARAARHGLVEADSPVAELRSALQEQLLATIPVVRDLLTVETVAPPSQRAIELFAELATVAALARGNYHEPQLTRGEVEDYLRQTAGFLNSFWHA